MKKLFALTHFFLLLLGLSVTSLSAWADKLKNINVEYQNNKMQIGFNFAASTKYSYFYLKNPDRLVIDFSDSQLNNTDMPHLLVGSVVKKVRTSKPPKTSTLRIVLELTNAQQATFNNIGNKVNVSFRNEPKERSNNTKSTSNFSTPNTARTKLIVAIDPGHGGKDPGAIGRVLRLREKEVTLSIAKELKQLLDKNPNFTAVLTRGGDSFISVPQRSNVARKYKANFLISIHADSAPNSVAKGASVWVLSNRRANTEMGNWLEDQEKQSQLLGGAGNVLAEHNEKYLGQTVLDLQFGYSQRVGYELGKHVLERFGQIAQLSRKTPQHASLGVLRAPDIPSILVETGFLSHREEEQKLSTLAYRKKIAQAIYNGLVDYYRQNTNLFYVTTESAQSKAKNSKRVENKKNSASSVDYHLVERGDTLSSISRKYNIKISELQKLNPHLKNNQVNLGQKIKLRQN